jgi:hypothetical protein
MRSTSGLIASKIQKSQVRASCCIVRPSASDLLRDLPEIGDCRPCPSKLGLAGPPWDPREILG